MTTQACKAILVGEGKGWGFLATVTDQDSWTALKDSVNTLNLYEVALGEKITKAAFGYVAGRGMLRIRNMITNQVKAMVNGTMIKGIGISMDCWEKFDAPIVVEQGDIVEAHCNVAST